MLERALLSFVSHYPEYEGAIGLWDEDAVDPPALIFAETTGAPKPVGNAIVLAVDILNETSDLAQEQALAVLRGESTCCGLIPVPFRTVQERGFIQSQEVTVIHYAQRSAGLKLVSIDGVVPSTETFRDGRYPLLTSLELRFTSPAAWWQPWRRPGAAARSFVEFVAAGTGQKAWYGAEAEITFLALGDIMLARNVGKKIEEHGVTYPFDLVHQVLDEHDVVFGNLESPIGTKGTPIPDKLIWFRARPEAAAALVHGGIDVVGMANNHILDYDSESLLETLEILDELGISHAGAGANISQAREPALVTVGEVTVALLAYTEFASEHLYWSHEYPRTFLATDDKPGCAPMKLCLVKEDVKRARQEADIIMVTYHWGQEYVNYPEPFLAGDLQDVARRTIDAGADGVLGTHPHAIQGIEIYRGKPIAYSLGNFVMDQYEPISTESMMISFTLDASGITSLCVIPVRIAEHRPTLAQGADYAYLMDKIRTISWPLRSR